MPTTRTKIRIGSLVTLVTAIVALLAAHPGRLAALPQQPDIIVTTVAELQAALSPSNAGARILVRAGVYDLTQALTVPDDATLYGEGVMIFDESGLPSGFEPSGRTLLRATTAVAGHVLSLRNGSAIRGLAIEDVAGRPVLGDVVAVSTGAVGDFIATRVEECEIVTPTPAVATTGRGLVLMTRNPDQEPPHEGSVLRVQMTRSIVRSPAAANGIFAINFASHSEIHLDLEGNVIGGGLSAAGGVGRPDSVTQAQMIIQSSHNLYRSDSVNPTLNGWQLFAGADAPVAGIVSETETFNSLQMFSINDTLSGFTTGINGSGARRINASSGSISSNQLGLNLHGTRLETITTDLRLSGATTALNVPTGDDNMTRVLIVQATGSGSRTNRYVDSAIPVTGNPGVGNSLEFVGNARAFDRVNQNIIEPPPASFFIGGH